MISPLGWLILLVSNVFFMCSNAWAGETGPALASAIVTAVCVTVLQTKD